MKSNEKIPGNPSEQTPGPRKGGRPLGQTNKLTATKLLVALKDVGLPFELALANNYLEAQGDPKLRFQYDQLFLGKLMADQHHISVDETTTVESRQAAFLAALNTIGSVALQQGESTTVDTMATVPQAALAQPVDNDNHSQ